MTKLESLQDIKDTAIELQAMFIEGDEELIMMVEKTFQQLVDQFYGENEDLMAPEQYEAAKSDFEYFSNWWIWP